MPSFRSSQTAAAWSWCRADSESCPPSVGISARSSRIRRSLGPRSTPSCPHTLRPLKRERSEEHTSELQSRFELVCRLLLEKNKLLRDAHHTYVSGKEDPAVTIKQLGGYIRHTHLKDSRMQAGEAHYVLTGRGEVPVQRQVE